MKDANTPELIVSQNWYSYLLKLEAKNREQGRGYSLTFYFGILRRVVDSNTRSFTFFGAFRYIDISNYKIIKLVSILILGRFIAIWKILISFIPIMYSLLSDDVTTFLIYLLNDKLSQ